MRIAVTGASGFIGRHVLSALVGRDLRVVATRLRGEPFRAGSTSKVQWISLDIREPPSKCLEELGRPDVLLHLAWAGLPNYRSLHHFETELPAQYRFLSGLIREGLSSLVVAGTCFEYGCQSGPLSPDQPTLPDNPYGFAKDSLRRQLEFLKNEHPFDLTWARLFYVYGEGQAESSLYAQLRKAISEGLPVFKMSGGEQLRDFMPVTEVAEHLTSLALEGEGLGIVNVCSGVPMSVRNLVEGWIRENGWDIELELGHFPYPDYEPMAFWGA
jgi:nucleoside-diphosphate-sugar epimerase